MEQENIEQGLQQEEIQKPQQEEQPEKVYSEDDFERAVNSRVNDLLGRKLGRKEAKIRKEYEERYSRLEDVLKAGTGKQDINEIAEDFAKFYGEKGITVPHRERTFSERETSILAKAEAEDIIASGDVEDEFNRLSALGDRATGREKQILRHLDSHRKNAERAGELSKIGADATDKDFLAFAGKFSDSVPITEVYEIYQKTKPKKNFTPPGSVKNTDSKDDAVKDFYTREEAMKFSRKELDRNPKLYAAIKNSMYKW